MKQVMMRCPETGEAVFTGLYLSSDATDKRLPFALKAVGCPRCGDLHVWTAEDAWLEAIPATSSETGHPMPDAGGGDPI